LDIVFLNDRLANEFNDNKALNQRYGAEQAKRIRRRLDDLLAATNLEVFRTLPGRCHELKGNLAGLLALDLQHPDRLIFEPANDPIPRKADGGLDWPKVTAVRILRVEDYHD
jgi:plasmid maintenance system killer protein